MWNSFLEKANNATFLFNRDFMEYHKDRFKDASLLIFKDEKLLALLPGNRVDDTLFSHQGLTYGELILKPHSKLEIVSSAFKEVLKYLNSSGINKMVLKEVPLIYKHVMDTSLSYLAYKSKGSIYRKDLLLVLVPKELKLSTSRKEGYRRAQKYSLQFREVYDFGEFWNTLLIPNLISKHGKSPVHTLEEITNLKRSFPKSIRQFNVYNGNRIVAGATIFETNEVAHVQYISGNEDKNELGSIDFLHIELIKDVFKSKSYFDFGMSHTDSGAINKGLHFWKEGFGCYSVTQDFIEIETKNYPLLDQVFV